jgi:hypothetical protein
VKIGTVMKLLTNMALEEVHIPLMLVGEMGIGKSWVVKDTAEIVNKKLIKKIESWDEADDKLFQCIDLRLATQEPGDIIGIPHDEDGRTYWSLPCWWPKPGTRGFLFLDELNRAPVDVRQAVFQLVTEWRLHTHELPKGWVIVSAINPDSGSYQVETLDKAMLRRFCQIKVVADAHDWLRWAENYGIDPRITKFIRENQKFLCIPSDFEVTAFPTPEGYRMVDEMLEMDVIPNEQNAKFEIVTGLVGPEAAAELKMYLEHEIENCIGAEEILDHYDSIRDKTQTQSHDRMNKTIEEFIVRFEKTGIPANNRQLENFVEFVKDLVPEYKTMLVMSLAENKELIIRMGKDRELKKQLIAIRKSANDE